VKRGREGGEAEKRRNFLSLISSHLPSNAQLWQIGRSVPPTSGRLDSPGCMLRASGEGKG